MNAYELPTALTVGGKSIPIRYWYKAAIDVFRACADPELDDAKKTEIMIRIIYPSWKEIPVSCMDEAVKKACEFLDCGQKPPRNQKRSARLIDWEQDAPLIMAAVNKSAGTEIRTIPNLHWWTFFGYFMEIHQSVYSNVLSIREQQSKGKRLDKPYAEWYRQNRHLVDMDVKLTSEEEEILKMWGGG